MATGEEIVQFGARYLNQKVTVPYNPYGGQCISYVDFVTTHFTGKNMAFTNAIDLLPLASARGFGVTYFTGNEIPKVGDIFVSRCTNHEYGHTGIVEKVDPTGTYFTTLEQNVDLNPNALENGGWVRRKTRTLYNTSLFTYDNDPSGLIPQYMVGWYRISTDTNIQKPPTIGSAITVNNEVYSSLTTNFNNNIMYSNLSEGVTDYARTKIDKIVVHHNSTTNKNIAMETWYESNGNWTSAHYEVADKELWGCVGENLVAFHSGNSDMNKRSIGIEHVNSTGAPNWNISEDTYNTSARLIADVCKRYNLPCDSNTIIPHNSVVATDCPGGIDLNKLIEKARQVLNNKVTSLEEIGDISDMDIVMRSASGKQGYVAITNGKVWGISHIETVKALQESGHKHLNLKDKDFNVLLNSQKR